MRKLGQDEEWLRHDLRIIQRALGLAPGLPPLALVKALRRIRQNAYQAGWNVVTRKVRRALKRGELVYVREKAA